MAGGKFDREFYLFAYKDVANSGWDPYQHWLNVGKKEGRACNRDGIPDDFDPDEYIAINEDVAEASADPYRHWQEYGKREGRAYRSTHTQLLTAPTQSNEPNPQAFPDDFEPDLYLALNPDLAKGKVDPYQHWINHGKREGRSATLPPLHIVGDTKHLDVRKKTLLVVNHEASRTGAPILGINMIRKLRKKFNIVSFVLQGGALLDDFIRLSSITVHLDKYHPMMAQLNIDKVVSIALPDFAIINSVVSCPVLRPLVHKGIPTVTFLHEFASYVHPISRFEEAIQWSHKLVFSSPITVRNAEKLIPNWVPTSSMHIIPQGRCPTLGNCDLRKLREVFRPPGCESAKVVIGLGSVEFRKGVDLFIQCAARILSLSKDGNIRFIWIGNGYRPNEDMQYSSYLLEQVERSDLRSRFVFLENIGNLDFVYREASLFLLTSRLDPLPNVGVDAVCVGLPILCFRDGSGIADILCADGLDESCVAPYLDTTVMAEKAIRILEDPDYKARVAKGLREVGKSRFDLNLYTEKVERLLEQAMASASMEEAEIEAIIASGQFDLDYWNAVNAQLGFGDDDETRAVRAFVRDCVSGLCLRKPNLDFDAELYALENEVSRDQAFFHHIKTAKLQNKSDTASRSNTGVAIRTEFVVGARAAAARVRGAP